MGSINSFGQAVQEILLNNYLKSNFENSEIRDFVPTFWNFIRGFIPIILKGLSSQSMTCVQIGSTHIDGFKNVKKNARGFFFFL